MTGPRAYFRNLISSLKASRSGTAVIEFALSFPTLVVVTLIIFDLGRAMFVFTTINNVAAEGARYISAHGGGSTYAKTEDDFIEYIEGRSYGLDPGSLDIDISYDPANTEGGEVTVTLTYPLDFFVTGFIGVSSVNVTGVAKMTVL